MSSKFVKGNKNIYQLAREEAVIRLIKIGMNGKFILVLSAKGPYLCH